MAQFIIVADRNNVEHRLNVDHIVAYLAGSVDEGGKSHIKMLDGFNIDVIQDIETVDRLIRNSDRRSIMSQS